jgi:hypothetical protein
MTLSTPIKVVALVGLALILGAAGLMLLASNKGATSSAAPPAQHTAVTKVVHIGTPAVRPAVHHAARPAKPKLVLDPTLPTGVAHKLMLSHELVAFVYTGASASDRALLMQARQGAHDARVPFVPLNVTDEKTADAVHIWTGSAVDPAVLVVKRPGKIVFQLTGPTDSQTVAQAAASAK